jgi:hypothetical protein
VTARRPNIVRIMLREIAHGWSEHSRPWADRAKPIMQRLVEVIEQARRSTRSGRRTAFTC